MKYILVPIEPTKEMLEAGEATFEPTYTGTCVSTPHAIWDAMIKAYIENKYLEMLKLLREHEYPEWVNWVCIDSEGIGIFSYEPELMNGSYCGIEKDYKADNITSKTTSEKPLLFTIEQIKNAKL